MRSIILLAVLLHTCVNAAQPSPSPGTAQHDLCSANPIDGIKAAQCIEIAEFYREIAYDVAANIAQRASQSSCAAIKGCNRGVHWHVPLPKNGCRHDVSYDDLVQALETHLHGRLNNAICQAECTKLVKPDGWELDVLFGTMKAAVDGQSACETPLEPFTGALTAQRSELL